MTNSNLRSRRSEHNPRLHRHQPGGRSDPQLDSRHKHCKQLHSKTLKVPNTRHNKWLTETCNIWSCSLLLLKQTNERWQTAGQQKFSKPKNQPICWPQVNKAQTTRQPQYRPIPASVWWQKLQPPQQSNPPTKISAQSLFNQRPGPPSALPATTSQTDTPGTGVLSSDCHSATHSKNEEQQQPPEQPAAHEYTPTEESSPASTLNESPEMQATDTAGASSPEPASESRLNVDLAAADIPTLQSMEKTARERVAFHETRLLNAREHLTRIRKRLKRMQDGQSSDAPQAAHVADMDMEIID